MASAEGSLRKILTANGMREKVKGRSRHGLLDSYILFCSYMGGSSR